MYLEILIRCYGKKDYKGFINNKKKFIGNNLSKG